MSAEPCTVRHKMKTILYRTLNQRERYYTIELLPNLFGESIVIRTYGSTQKIKPTGAIREVYPNQADAQCSADALIASKYRRGYRPKTTNIPINSLSDRLIGENEC